MQGIQAGLSAGMKVIGITTSHTAEELVHTHLQAPDFTTISYDTLVELLGWNNF
jgi:beta-phosphoglucomutase-like phosphatase (HAD superfamily)